MMLGFKKDLVGLQAVPKEDVNDLVRVMKEYIRCEMLYTSNLYAEEVLSSILCMFSLCEDYYDLHPRPRDFETKIDQYQSFKKWINF